MSQIPLLVGVSSQPKMEKHFNFERGLTSDQLKTEVQEVADKLTFGQLKPLANFISNQLVALLLKFYFVIYLFSLHCK